MDINLGINRTINTRVMVFTPANEDQYGDIESTITEEFWEQDFGQVVALNVDEANFCQYWLSADIENEPDFHKACAWLLGRMEDLGATLSHLS